MQPSILLVDDDPGIREVYAEFLGMEGYRTTMACNLAEAREGNYDLLCMGSPYSSHTLRQLYTPNVTAEIAETDLVPVLTARYARGSTQIHT